VIAKRTVGRRGQRAKPPRQLVAIHPREPDVHQRDMRRKSLGHGERADAVVRDLHRMTDERQRVGERRHRVGVVVHDEDAKRAVGHGMVAGGPRLRALV
jgi:hypothetical protein